MHESFSTPSRPCIKSKQRRIVKPAISGPRFKIILWFASICILIHSGCTSPSTQRTGVGHAEKSLDASEIEKLPPIDVRLFKLKVVRHTHSGAVYLFDITDGEIPAPGRITLLKNEKINVMAFRVLKVYPEKNQFAGRKLRVYEGYTELSGGDAYAAIEKIADVSSFGPSQDDRNELNELEGVDAGTPPVVPTAQPEVGSTAVETPTQEEVERELGPILEYDPELDSETSPPPKGAVDTTGEGGVTAEFTPEGPSNDELDDSGISVEEVTPLEPNPNSLTATLGFLRNGEGSSFPAGGVRAAFRLGKMLFLKKPLLQDELSGEMGGFLYKAIFTQNDVFSVFPLVFSARYTIHMSEDLSAFVYGGIMKNFAIPAQTSYNVTTYNSLLSVVPAVGGGFLFRVGPSWHARVDVGYDMLGLGLMIGF